MPRVSSALLLACILLACTVGASAQAHVGDEVASADLPIPGLTFSSPSFGAKLEPVQAAVAPEPLPAPAAPASGRFELVGHDPLLKRGMNSAIAVLGDYAYVGSRTDGSNPNSGVLVVDVKDPVKPSVVDQIGPPNEGNVGESSREMRILPDQKLLLVLNHGCSELIHRCANPATLSSVTRSNIKFYDIAGENAANPKLVSTYFPSRSAAQQPHEFFIWSDPQRPGRVLAYMSTPTTTQNGSSTVRPNLIVADLSRARENEFSEVATFAPVVNPTDLDERLHSLSVSNDGRQAYLAYLGGGFLVADTSDFADAKEKPEVRLTTPVENRVFWNDPGAHSAAKLPGRPHVMITDEVYGKLGGVLADHGCPWGWTRFIDIDKPETPRLEAEYKLPSNNEDICDTVGEDRENFSSFASHNPTMTRNLALLTWHSAGLQAVDTSDPANPKPAAEFRPEPLDRVQTEDPALSSGRDKVVMWSFPIVKDGLIYVVDIRNGLYIMRYKGPHEDEVSSAKFLDGNSNSGDVAKIEPVDQGTAPQQPGSGTGSGSSSGSGSAASGAPAAQTAPAASPPMSRGKACLAFARLSGKRLGPFSIGMRAGTIARRGGPAERSSRGRRRYCVQGGSGVEVLLRRNRAAVLLRSLARPPLRSGAPNRIRVRRGRVVNRVVVIRGRRLVATGIAQRGLSPRTLRRLIARAE